jgi:hypothetical protein
MAPARRQFDRLPISVAAAVLETLDVIAENPKRLRKHLALEHEGRWSALRGPYALGHHGRDVVALVDDDVTVAGQQLVERLVASQALDHRDVHLACGLAATAADRPDLVCLEIEELVQVLDPLFEQRLAVDEHERRASPGGDQPSGDHCLADARRCAQDAELVSEHRRPRPLDGRSALP